MLVNRKTIDQVAQTPLIVHVRAELVYFSASTAAKLDITGGDYIHFNNDEEHWTFWVNNDPDGFLCTSEHNGSVRVFSRPLAQLILKSVKKSPVAQFYVIETMAKLDGSKVFEILTNKTVKETGKETV